jgi:hypothetical protein
MYSETVDAASGKASRQFMVSSTNMIELGFPYMGPQRGHLEVRQHPRWGQAVIFSVDRGQIVSCGSYRRGVTVRFDESVDHWACAEPEDGSNTSVFINRDEAFIKRMKKAQVTVVSVLFYQQGEFSFEFKTAGFEGFSNTR